MNARELAVVGLAVERTCQTISKWTVAIKYSAVACTDTQEYSDLQHGRRHRANTAVRNLTGALRDLGAALQKGREKKAMRIAHDLLLAPDPSRHEWDASDGRKFTPESPAAPETVEADLDSLGADPDAE